MIGPFHRALHVRALGKWLRECNSVRSGQAWAEPEIWFRIRHVAVDGGGGGPVATYREQTVEIALGPKGAFEGASVGTLTRRVTADRVVGAASRAFRPSKPPRPARRPRVVELLRKAQEWRRQLDSGEVDSQADLARREGLTRARVTQVLAMLRLAPEIQEHVASLPEALLRTAITERALRSIVRIRNLREQMQRFQELCPSK